MLDSPVRPLLPVRNASYTARLALDAETRLDAYRLRYDAYLSQGFIAPNVTGMFVDEYDGLPNTLTMVIYLEDRPVGSVRTCSLSLGSGQRSAAVDVYPDAVVRLLRENRNPGFGQRGLEVNRMVRSPACENNQGLVFLLYRMAGYIAMTTHTQIIFACVRINHVPLYRRLGYQEAAEPRSYPGLSCPMQLLYCTRETYDDIRAAYPVIDPYTRATGSLDGFLAGEPVCLSASRP
jgi:hypothetical protein